MTIFVIAGISVQVLMFNFGTITFYLNNLMLCLNLVNYHPDRTETNFIESSLIGIIHKCF